MLFTIRMQTKKSNYIKIQVKKNDFIIGNVNQIKNSTNHMLIITVLNNTAFLQLSVLQLMSTATAEYEEECGIVMWTRRNTSSSSWLVKRCSEKSVKSVSRILRMRSEIPPKSEGEMNDDSEMRIFQFLLKRIFQQSYQLEIEIGMLLANSRKYLFAIWNCLDSQFFWLCWILNSANRKAWKRFPEEKNTKNYKNLSF